MGARIRDHRWAETKLGDMTGWSPTLRSTLGICLHSAFPCAIYWGDDHRLFYNDAWAPIAGAAHPHALGRPAHEVCRETWDTIAPQIARVREGRYGIAARDASLTVDEDDLYWDYSFAPITEPDGSIAGVLGQGHETTARVHAARRDAVLVELDDALRDRPSVDTVLAAALPLIGAALDADCAGVAEVDLDTRSAVVPRCWTTPAMLDLTGAQRLPGPDDGLVGALRQGQPHAIEDAAHDPRLSDVGRARCATAGIAAALVVPIMRHGNQVTTLFLHDREPHRWTAPKRALAAAAGARLAEAIARTRAGAALRDAGERHRLIFERTGAILFSADPQGRLTACNPAAAHAFGRPAAALVLHPLQSLIADDGYARLTAALAAAHGGTATIDIAVPNDGRRCDWDVAATPAIDAGQAGGFHALARDVTARRAVERRQTVMINELNHRVKNTLALVQGLAFQTFRPDRDVVASRATFEARLGALARAHDLLTAASWEGAELAEIADAATRDQRDPPGRVAIAGPRLTIAPKPAIALALALHELAANAAAHGALREPAGRAAIGWSVADGRLRLAWRETGGTASAGPPPRTGFGLRMVQRVLAAEFGGTVRIDFAADGLSCTLDAPLPPHAAPDVAS